MYDDVRIFEPRILDPRVVLSKPRIPQAIGTPMDEARRLRAETLRQMGSSISNLLRKALCAQGNVDRSRSWQEAHSDGDSLVPLLPAAIGPWRQSQITSLIDGAALRSDAVLGHRASDGEQETPVPVPFTRRLAA